MPHPGIKVGQFIFYCNSQHLRVAPPWYQGRAVHFLLQFTASGSCPTLAPGSGNSFSVAIYSIWELPDPGIRVGQSIFHCNLQDLGGARPWYQGRAIRQFIVYCNLQHLGVSRPWRQGRAMHFLLQFTASGSCPTLPPGSGNSFSIAIYSI